MKTVSPSSVLAEYSPTLKYVSSLNRFSNQLTMSVYVLFSLERINAGS